MIRFSIIIPTFNSEHVLGTALASLAGQSFRDFEILIIDGVSSDDTLKIARSFKDKLPSIRIFSEPDQGIYDAMNKGIKKANGEWLYFLGSDDKLFSPHILARVNEETTGVDVIYGNVNSTRLGEKYDGQFDDMKIINKNICHQAIFIKKNVFGAKGYYDLRYKIYADWEHNLQWFLSKNVRKKYIDETIAYYADDGTSSDVDPLFLEEKMEKVVWYGYDRLPVDLLERFLIEVTYRRKRERKYFSFLKYRLMLELLPFYRKYF